MKIEIKTFIEVQDNDGYWREVNAGPDTSFLCSYCDGYDGYINPELFVGLSNIRDGYFSNLFRRKTPTDLSKTVRYKMSMLDCLGYQTLYHLLASEINMFDWTKVIYGSPFTSSTTFMDVSGDFLSYYLPVLNSLGNPMHVRLVVLKK